MFDYHFCRLTLIEKVRKALNCEKSNKTIDTLEKCNLLIQEVAKLIDMKIKEQE